MEDDEETVILRFQSYHSYFFKKMAGSRAECFFTGCCSKCSDSLIRHRTSDGKLVGVIFRINRDRVVFSAAAVFFNSVTGILGLLTLSVLRNLDYIWDLYVDWTLLRTEMVNPADSCSLYVFGFVDETSGYSDTAAYWI
ncbi:MAG: hypothetical protein ACLTQG_28255 [Hungatella sp.]|uniref:hypothetical protein n=1 Tax=Hungatella sp. TaxID=2613924 RepID=UPI0039958C1D